MAELLDLPLEILIEILCYLDVIDTYKCRRTCRLLCNVISDSLKLEYCIKLNMAGMQDNPYCKLSIADRLSALDSRESSWRFANWNFFTGVEVPSRWSGVYDLTPSVYLLGKSSSDFEVLTTGVQTIKLPYQFQDISSVEWTEFNFGMDIIDFGTAIEEHDLLACVSSVPDENDFNVRHIVVVLFRYSGQKMHDGCINPVIHVCSVRLTEGVPNVSIEIAGENLAVIVIFNRDLTNRHDFLHIFDWKNGKPKSEPLPVHNTGLTFLREDLLLNPNVVRKSLDVYHIPSSSSATSSTTPIRLIHSFLLPPITLGHRITNVSCRSDPNPTANASFPKYTRFNRPFSNDPACAIIILTLEIRGDQVRNFVMIMHRKALLDLLLVPPRNPPVGVTVDSSGHPVSIRWTSLPRVVTSWKSWGPPNTRWFNADDDDFATAFITTTAGQRCVQFVPSIGNAGRAVNLMADTIVILDFNPWHVKRAEYDLNVHGSNEAVLVGKGSGGAYEVEENTCLSHGSFEEDIQCRLPFVACKVPDKWEYDAVLLDEERILGIRTDDVHSSLDVMYFG